VVVVAVVMEVVILMKVIVNVLTLLAIDLGTVIALADLTAAKHLVIPVVADKLNKVIPSN
jgi:hypothetical protein